MDPTQIPILTVTLNPALDLTTATGTVSPGPKLRCERPRTDPGGGGVNASRVIARLGGQSRALVALGGVTGQALGALLAAEGIVVLPLEAPGETRQSLTVNEASTGAQFRFVLPGPDWPPDAVAGARDRILSLARGGMVLLSGSQPPGFPDDFPGQLTAALRGQAGVALDTSGAALAVTARTPDVGLAILRMDAHEAETLFGQPLPRISDTAARAAAMVAEGVADEVILARGAEGSVLATGAGCWHCRPPVVTVQSKVGAGDSFMAAYLLARARGLAPSESLHEGTAAATAAVTTPGTELCRATTVTSLRPGCSLHKLP
jgi:6-phosphofructokinase 2